MHSHSPYLYTLDIIHANNSNDNDAKTNSERDSIPPLKA